MRKIRIGFLFDDSLDRSDGVQQYITTVGEWMRAQGHEVHYLVGETVRTDIPKIHSMSKNINVRFNKNRLSIPLFASRRRIRRTLDELKLDILHVQMPYSPMMSGRVIRAASPSTKIVGTFHIIPFSSIERQAARTLGLMQSRFSLQKVQRVIAVSEPAAEFARYCYGFPCHVLPNVVNVAKFRHGRKLDKFKDNKLNIVFLGRLVERKGAHYLLDAVAKLPKSQYRLIVCGTGSDLAKLQTKSLALGLDKNVAFEGYIPESEKPNYLASADIAVFPSIGGESFGIVLLEAIAAKAGVVIGGNNAGYRTVLNPWPRTLVDPTNTSEFTQSLKYLISHSETRHNIHRSQQKAIAQYDVEKIGLELSAEYLKLLESSN